MLCLSLVLLLGEQGRKKKEVKRYNDKIIYNDKILYFYFILACDEGPGICAILLTICSVLLILVTLPLSLLVTVKVVQVRTGEKACQ